MNSLKRVLRAARREDGLTLMELLWVGIVGVLVFGLGLAMLNFAVRAQPRLSDRAASIQEGRALIERLTRELRQGAEVSVATPSQLVFVTYVRRTSCGGGTVGDSTACQVTYSCAGGSCTRMESNPDGTGGGASDELVNGLSSDSVFSYLPSATAPEYVNVRLEFPASDEPGEEEDAVTLQDGVNLRNSAIE